MEEGKNKGKVEKETSQTLEDPSPTPPPAMTSVPESRTISSSDFPQGDMDDDMPTPRDDDVDVGDADLSKRPLHETSTSDAVSAVSTTNPSSKRFKTSEFADLAPPAPDEGYTVSSSASTPVTSNSPLSKYGVNPPPPSSIPRPKRMARRRSSFGSDTLRVSTPKRKTRPRSYSSLDGAPPTPSLDVASATPVLQPTPRTSTLHSSGSSSYGEHEILEARSQPLPMARSQSQSSWGDDDEYYSQPKTPRAPLPPPPDSAPMRQHTGESSASASWSDLSYASANTGSSAGGAELSRALSPVATYVPDVPPAPPSTPASTGAALNRRVIKDMGLATPLPSSASFVQNVHQLEQRQLQLQQLLADGAETPAPPRPTKPQTTQDQKQAPTESTPAPSEAAAPASAQSRLSATDSEFSEWAVGDRYQLLRMLGQGSYGQVAQALDLKQARNDTYVAVKRIQSPFDQEVDAIRLFRELHILRRLKGHECIIQLLDVGQPPSEDLDDFHDLYLVFEYVDTDLYKLIMSPQYLSTEHIQTFLYQMLCALKFIHSANVIHRDLKPANILLNEDCSLKICDFGLARVVDESSVMASSKQDLLDRAEKKADSRTIDISDLPPTVAQSLPENMTLGRQLTKHVVTRWYRAPELILIQPYTTAVDMWSLGCIFAELLGMQRESIPDFEDRTPLFPGGKCYPLSGDADTEERLDQLSVIFGVIGTPSKEDIDEVGKANEYIQTLGDQKPKKLENLYPAADPAALDLLRQMLKFNPRHRCTATEALAHDFFQGIRRPEMETSIDRPLTSPEFLHSDDIDIDVLKRKTYEEVIWFRDNVDRYIAPGDEVSEHPEQHHHSSGAVVATAS